MHIPPGKFKACLVRVDVRCRHIPDVGLMRTVPADHDGSGWRGVPQLVRMLCPHCACRGAICHPSSCERQMQPSSDILSTLAWPCFVRQPAESKHGEIAFGHDIGTEAGPPDLDKRRI